jgi:hypothetical protein
VEEIELQGQSQAGMQARHGQPHRYSPAPIDTTSAVNAVPSLGHARASHRQKEQQSKKPLS